MPTLYVENVPEDALRSHSVACPGKRKIHLGGGAGAACGERRHSHRVGAAKRVCGYRAQDPVEALVFSRTFSSVRSQCNAGTATVSGYVLVALAVASERLLVTNERLANALGAYFPVRGLGAV